MKPENAQGHDIVVVGASAGGVEAIREIVRGLPPDFPAAVFVVIHFPPDGTSVLPAILERVSSLPVAHAVDGEEIVRGRIYVAIPDYHLLLEPGRMRLVHGPMENRYRPAIDPLFRSAARAYGPRVVGVVLTGALDDGTSGLHAIKVRGGVAVVQDPADALYPSMPRSAMEYVDVDHCVPLAAVAETLSAVAASPAAVVPPDETPDGVESAAIAVIEMGDNGNSLNGEPSVFTCPDCHGTLWEMRGDGVTRFRCRVGHAWSVESMVAAQDESTERALWAALRALEESTALAHRMAEGARARGSTRSAGRFDDRARESEENAARVRDLLMLQRSASAPGVPDVVTEGR